MSIIALALIAAIAAGTGQNDKPFVAPFVNLGTPQDLEITSEYHCSGEKFKVVLSASPNVEIKSYAFGERQATAEELAAINAHLVGIADFTNFRLGCQEGGFHGISIWGLKQHLLPDSKRILAVWSPYGFQVNDISTQE